MPLTGSKEKNAVEFVNLLTPGNFPEAQRWLADSCEYHYQGKVLRGSDIIRSFSDNHESASEKLDIHYVDGWVEKVEGDTVFVGVQDDIRVGEKIHHYRDCLAITGNGKSGEGSIDRIEHCPIPEERMRLQAFLQSVEVEQ